jgi:agmatine deiminase
MNTNRRLPAEWERHKSTWLAWPEEPGDWPGKLRAARLAFCEMVRIISAGETARIVCGSKRQRLRCRSLLDKAGADPAALEFYVLPKDRGWTRDSLPFFVRDGGGLSAVKFAFNAWARYKHYEHDEALGQEIARLAGIPLELPEAGGRRVVLEGGAVDVNGSGTLLTTEECLLGKPQERNPGFGKQDYERLFADYLGVRHTVWLGRGIAGDDTHGHVDDCCRFVNETTVAACMEDDEADPNHAPLRDNLERLQSARTAKGGKLEIVELPMPRPVFWAGQRLPASYANFYVCNAAVLAPTFNDPADAYALGLLGDLFPDRETVGVHARDLVLGLGAMHCLTHEEPEG